MIPIHAKSISNLIFRQAVRTPYHTMPHLPLDTAAIYYELYPEPPTTPTTGPLLLLIHGGNGTLNGYRALATHLAHHYPTLTTLLYDRRGYSRSPLTGPQSYANGGNLATDAADACALMKHFSATGTAIVFGNSSGAIVGMELLTRYPEAVEAFVCHEPPAVGVIEDRAVREQWMGKQRQLYELYREKGHVAAMKWFGELVMAEKDPGWGTTRTATGADMGAVDPFAMGNLLYWLEREVLGFVAREVDLEGLGRAKGKLVLCNGKETHEEAPQALANREMARRLEVALEMFEGGHLAWKDGETFAGDMMRVLAARGIVFETRGSEQV